VKIAATLNARLVPSAINFCYVDLNELSIQVYGGIENKIWTIAIDNLIDPGLIIFEISAFVKTVTTVAIIKKANA
jgi:hypothetical protein